MKNKVTAVAVLAIGAGMAFPLLDQGFTVIEAQDEPDFVIRVAPPPVLPDGSAAQNSAYQISRPDDSETGEDRMTAALAEAVTTISHQYEAQAKYPPHSIPVRDANDLVRLLRDNRSGSYVPWRFDDGSSIEVSLEVNQYNFAPGDDLVWSISTDGRKLSKVEVSVRDRKGNTIASGTGASGRLKLPETLPDPSVVEYEVKATGMFRGRMITAVAPVRIEAPVAVASGVSASEACGNHLCVTVDLDVQKGGFYYVQGVLYDAEAQPLAYLSTEKALQEGAQKITFQVYAQILKERQAEGDYWLSDLNIVRAAGIGEKHDSFGTAKGTPYKVAGHDLSSYSDELWSDPVMDERVAFLKQLGKQ